MDTGKHDYNDIFEAIDANDLEGVRRLLVKNKKNANIVQDHSGFTPLYAVINQDCPNEKIVQLLVDNGADLNAIDSSSNEIPLNTAITYQRCSDTFKLLIKLGADLGAKNGEGQTPLHFAAYIGDLQAVKLLVTEITNLKEEKRIRAFNDINDALICTIKNIKCLDHQDYSQEDAKNVVEILIKAGANLGATDIEGKTPLYYAVETRSLEIVNLVLNQICALQEQPSMLNNALNGMDDILICAIENGDIKIFQKVVLMTRLADKMTNLQYTVGENVFEVAKQVKENDLRSTILQSLNNIKPQSLSPSVFNPDEVSESLYFEPNKDRTTNHILTKVEKGLECSIKNLTEQTKEITFSNFEPSFQ